MITLSSRSSLALSLHCLRIYCFRSSAPWVLSRSTEGGGVFLSRAYTVEYVWNGSEWFAWQLELELELYHPTSQLARAETPASAVSR